MNDFVLSYFINRGSMRFHNSHHLLLPNGCSLWNGDMPLFIPIWHVCCWPKGSWLGGGCKETKILNPNFRCIIPTYPNISQHIPTIHPKRYPHDIPSAALLSTMAMENDPSDDVPISARLDAATCRSIFMSRNNLTTLRWKTLTGTSPWSPCWPRPCTRRTRLKCKTCLVE